MKLPDDAKVTRQSAPTRGGDAAITVHGQDDSPYGRGLLALRTETRIVPTETPDENASGYLRMAAHILLRSQRDQFRTIGVISARDGEGKTTTAVNLAVCLGSTKGRVGRVLLVDGDVKNRDLTQKICGPENGDRKKHPMLVSTAFDCVDLMTAPRGDGTTLYDPMAWSQTLRDLAERYAQVVIDVPAVLEHPEGLILRECADELVLVVRVGETKKSDVETALGGHNHRVLGVVMTGEGGDA